METNRDKLSADLHKLRRESRIEEAHSTYDALVEFRALVDGMPTMGDEDRVELRTKLMNHLWGFFEGASAETTNERGLRSLPVISHCSRTMPNES